MINRIKKSFKIATVQRQRREHREALLLERIKEINKKLNNLLKEQELTNRLNLIEI